MRYRERKKLKNEQKNVLQRNAQLFIENQDLWINFKARNSPSFPARNKYLHSLDALLRKWSQLLTKPLIFGYPVNRDRLFQAYAPPSESRLPDCTPTSPWSCGLRQKDACNQGFPASVTPWCSLTHPHIISSSWGIPAHIQPVVITLNSM